MSENNMNDWVFLPAEESEDVSPVEEEPAERIGDFMVRNGNEVVEYVGTSTIIIIPEGITKIGLFFLEGKYVTEVRIPSTVTEMGIGSFLEVPDLKNIFVDEANPDVAGSHKASRACVCQCNLWNGAPARYADRNW